jgi:polar amino acid transport system permease protein
MSMRYTEVFNSIPYLLQGVGTTLEITIYALFLGAFFGLLLALARVYGGNISRRFAILYSRIIRSLPLLVILFLLFYLGTEVINFSEFQAVILALAIHTSAYQSEIFRGSIQSISKGQMEAALALGMSKTQGIFTIILPQALRRAIPYWGNEASIVLKDSSFAYVLGVLEILRRGEFVIARTGQALITYIIVGIIYLILTSILTKCLSIGERKFRIPGL